MQICHLNAFNDNYIWIIKQDQNVIVVDPGLATIVKDYIIANNLQLKAILLTHGHNDHVGGVADLCASFNDVLLIGNCEINKIRNVNDGESLELFAGIFITAITTPGHTYDAVSYLLDDKGVQHLFCGDTLFAAGCGRVFTEDYALMYASLQKILDLDDEVLVYPGHEYTLKNLQFAKMLEPSNDKLRTRIIREQEKMQHLDITLPTTIAIERETNPFLRLNDHQFQQQISMLAGEKSASELDYFIKIRQLRNNF